MPIAPPPQQGAPQGQPGQPQGQPGPNPAQAIQQIQQGFATLAKLIQANANQMDPQDVKLFQMAVKATDDFIQAISSAAPQGQQRPAAGGPMPPNARPGSQQSPNQG